MNIHDYLSENGYPEHVVRAGRDGLVKQYRHFIKQVEHGYPLGLEDYRNDLDARAILSLAEAEDEEVHELDHRLKDLLIATDKRVWESSPDAPFWDFGYPNNAGPQLIEDLRSEELA